MKDYFSKINWLIVLLASVTAIGLSIIYSLSYGIEFLEGFKQLLKGVIPNLVAVLIAIPIVFIFFHLKGISPQEELKQSILDELITLQNFNSEIQSSDVINEKFDLNSLISTTKSIDIIALSAYNIITKFRSRLTDAIAKGCKVRILIVQPQSPASKIIMANQSQGEIEPDLASLMGRIDQIEATHKEKNIKRKGTLEIRGMNWVPSCSLIIVNRKSNNSLMRVKIYPITIDIPLSEIKTHTLIHSHLKPELFSYFSNQFSAHWKSAVKIRVLK